MDRATGAARSGIAQTASGDAYIPSSTRADGSKRKEIRVRPGYVPPEDIETYKNQGADALKNRGKAGIPGAEGLQSNIIITDGKSKNAKRRDAAKKRLENQPNGDELAETLHKQNLDEDKLKADWRNPEKLQTSTAQSDTDEAERQKKIRNALKKLKAVRELKERRAAGEKMSIDQVAKMGKEPELLRDLSKLKYEGPETTEGGPESGQ
jgi:partner of Y14 and mago protein